MHSNLMSESQLKVVGIEKKRFVPLEFEQIASTIYPASRLSSEYGTLQFHIE